MSGAEAPLHAGHIRSLCYNAGMRIIGLAGWSGSGKTTLLTKVIPRLVARGLAVSTLKHAHHGFDVDQPGKDSHSHRMAGATEVLVGSADALGAGARAARRAGADARRRCWRRLCAGRSGDGRRLQARAASQARGASRRGRQAAAASRRSRHRRGRLRRAAAGRRGCRWSISTTSRASSNDPARRATPRCRMLRRQGAR